MVSPVLTRTVPTSGNMRRRRTTVRSATVSPGVYEWAMSGARVEIHCPEPLHQRRHSRLLIRRQRERPAAAIEQQSDDASLHILGRRSAWSGSDADLLGGVDGDRRMLVHAEREQAQLAKLQLVFH